MNTVRVLIMFFVVVVCSDLFITTSGGGNVNIQKMESDVCQVQTDTGNCVLTSVRVCLLDSLLHHSLTVYLVLYVVKGLEAKGCNHKSQ